MGMVNPYEQYQQNAVQSADSGDLLIMLYDGLVKYLKLSINCIEQKNIEGANKAMIKSQDIIKYLNGTLDESYDVSHYLSALYDFMGIQLMKANIKKDMGIINEILDMVQELRDTWRQASQIAKTQVL